jgi:hypothetical protein
VDKVTLPSVPEVWRLGTNHGDRAGWVTAFVGSRAGGARPPGVSHGCCRIGYAAENGE